MSRIVKLALKAGKFWTRFEPIILLVGATASFIIWAYSNFASASEVQSAKVELRAYVDIRHDEVKEQLRDIKSMLQEQRELSSRILLRIGR